MLVPEIPFSPNAWLRYDMLQQLLARVPHASSFVEVGCGMGALASRLVDRYRYVGYEPDGQCYAVARTRVANRGAVINDVLPSVPTDRFHLLGAFEVLEHQPDDSAALTLWREWIRPGGNVLLSVPANQDRYAPADVVAGHYRRYDRAGLAQLLKRCGFDEVTVWAYGFPLGYALEFARNRLASKAQADVHSYGTRTGASGRFHQPPDSAATLIRLGTGPFRLLQRPFRRTSLGTGLVAMARLPA
jgi:SAM-dependent methyltransferase